MKFIVVTAFRNVERYIGRCIDSIKNQSYENFLCVLADDNSSDSTSSIYSKAIQGDERFVVKRSESQKFALENIILALDDIFISDEDVLVFVDGDDWLYRPDVFERLAHVYSSSDVLLTFGNYVKHPQNTIGHCSPYTKLEIKQASYRSSGWRASHLRTMKYKLWRNIDKKDLKDENGEYLTVAADMAIMFPALEMAADRQYCFRDIMYVYNCENPQNEFKVRAEKQRQQETIIRAAKKYDKIC